MVQGEAHVRGEHVLALQFIQARDPSWVGRPFFARYDPDATWLDQLTPAFGEASFFFERLGHGRLAKRRLLAGSGRRQGAVGSGRASV